MVKKGLLVAAAGSLLMSIAFFSVTASSTPPQVQEKHKEFWQTLQTVKDILAGRNAENARASIAKHARLIYGKRSEDLWGVVEGENRSCTLADTSYQGVEIDARTNDAEDMGVLVLKTRKVDTTYVRYHTVVFLKDSTGQFKIISWHTGD